MSTLKVDTLNGSTGSTITVPSGQTLNIVGSLTGAISPTIADESTDTTCFPLFSTAATGNLAPKSGSNLTFNSNTGLLTATLFAGALTGNVTGTASIATTVTVTDNESTNEGNVTGTSSIATSVTVADESSDATCFPTFVTAATGNLPPKTGSNLTFNSNTGLLTAGALTTAGVTTIGSLVGGTVATEHGAGAVATSFAPITRRYTQNGVIITKIHFDLTALGAKGGTANDVIGLPAGGNAFIGRYVTSTYGIVYRAEIACIELPAVASGTVTTDIDIATNASGTIAYDAAGGTAKLFNTGGMVAGQELSNITPAITANNYFYLVEGDTAASDAVFNAGQFILTLYGHAIS